MVDSLPISLIVGVLLGFLAGLGVGGGSLLILWLTLIIGTETGIARAINLMFFMTAAGAVSLIRWRKGSLNIRKLLPAIVAGCVTAALFSWLRVYLHSELMKKLFGILLLFTGVRELFYRPRKAK
jgi:uncharacterized membrane protein YfcA